MNFLAIVLDTQHKLNTSLQTTPVALSATLVHSFSTFECIVCLKAHT